jgi:NTP pyrophosphatase (non-canonical NTP hydrolase)
MIKQQLSFDTLRKANIERDKEWNPDKKLTPLFRATELAGEVGEALNVVKKLEREKLGLVGSRATLEQLRNELADIMICVDLLAMEYGIDMAYGTAIKFNDTSMQRGLHIMIGAGDCIVKENNK